MPRSLLLLLFLIPAVANAELRISDAWVKHLPASIPVRAGYMTLYNPSSRPVVIESVRSETFASIEIHTTVEQDGLMQMQHLQQLTVDADSSVQLAPGGLHLMMMGPVVAPTPGDLITVTIEFVDGAEQSFGMIVKE
jgi:periplasmic copper chaperone A